MHYDEVYALVKSAGTDLQTLLDREPTPLDAVRIRRLCEMILTRVYDDWYWGNPAPNISKSVHEHCRALLRNEKRPLSQVRRAGALLAWSYTRLDHDSDDAFLLLEHVLSDLTSDDGRIIAPDHRHEMSTMLLRWRDDRGVPAELDSLTESEREIWDEIMRWQIEPTSRWSPISKWTDSAKQRLADMAPEVITRVLLDAFKGGLIAMQDAAHALTRDNAILEDVANRGYTAGSLRQLFDVPINVLDDISASSMLGGKVLAALEGAGTGAGGPIFIAADIPAVMTLNLRYMTQIAHTYGFETDSQRERMYLLNLLGAASADRGSKTAFLNNLNRVAVDVARGRSWKDLNEHAVVGLVRQVAAIIGTKLTKKKLVQLIPIVGAAVGAGVNYAYTHENLETARMMYRKRWLIQRCIRQS